MLSQGSLFGQPVAGFVSPPGVSVLLGAFLFGIGMQLGGGCALGHAVRGRRRQYPHGGHAAVLHRRLGHRHGNFGWWSALPALAPTSLVKSWGLAPALIANLAVFALIAWAATALEKRRHGHVISFASRTARPGSLLQGPGR